MVDPLHDFSWVFQDGTNPVIVVLDKHTYLALYNPFGILLLRGLAQKHFQYFFQQSPSPAIVKCLRGVPRLFSTPMIYILPGSVSCTKSAYFHTILFLKEPLFSFTSYGYFGGLNPALSINITIIVKFVAVVELQNTPNTNAIYSDIYILPGPAWNLHIILNSDDIHTPKFCIFPHNIAFWRTCFFFSFTIHGSLTDWTKSNYEIASPSILKSVWDVQSYIHKSYKILKTPMLYIIQMIYILPGSPWNLHISTQHCFSDHASQSVLSGEPGMHISIPDPRRHCKYTKYARIN